MNNFNEYSTYYNLLYQDKPYKEESKYINNLIQKFNPNTSTILNLGCGTGKHDIELLNYGYSIHGVDLSNKMIGIAQKAASSLNNLSFSQGNIQTVRLDNTFDTIISLFHVMSYQNTAKEIIDTLTTVKQHLKDDGVFIFDCWNKPAILKDPPISRTKKFHSKEFIISRKSIPNWIKEKDIIEVNFEITVDNKKIKQTLRELHTMRYFSKEDIQFFSEKTGFKIENSYNWMTFNPVSDQSWYSIYILKKYE